MKKRSIGLILALVTMVLIIGVLTPVASASSRPANGYWLEELYVIKPQDSTAYYVCYTEKRGGETYYYDANGTTRCILDGKGNEKSGWKTSYRETLGTTLKDNGINRKNYYKTSELWSVQESIGNNASRKPASGYWLEELYVVNPQDSTTYYVCYTEKRGGETYYYDASGITRCMLDANGNEKNGWTTNYRDLLGIVLKQEGINRKNYYRISDILDVQADLQDKLVVDTGQAEYKLHNLYVVKPKNLGYYYICYAKYVNGETYLYDMNAKVRCVLDVYEHETGGWKSQYRETLKNALNQAEMSAKSHYSEAEIRALEKQLQEKLATVSEQFYAMFNLYVVETAKENGYQYICYSRGSNPSYIGVVDGEVHYDAYNGWGNNSKIESLEAVVLELRMDWKSQYTVAELSNIQNKINTADNILVHSLYHSKISLRNVYWMDDEFYVRAQGKLVRVFDQEVFDYREEQNYLIGPIVQNGVVEIPGAISDYRTETWRFSAEERKEGEVTFKRLKEIQT